MVPAPQQVEAVAWLIAWITSPAAQGLTIPRIWVGLTDKQMALGRVNDAGMLRPGICAHTYFDQADGAWLVLYAYLRIEKGRTPEQAYAEAIQMATTRARSITVG